MLLWCKKWEKVSHNFNYEGKKLLRQRCIWYLCYTTEVKEEEMKIEDISVAYELTDVFRKELST